MGKTYTYRVIRENAVNGQQGKRAKLYCCFKPLQVGSLYTLVGQGFHRILELVSVEDDY